MVVLLVVDQLPSWTFSRHKDTFRGGFARLIREGAYYPEAEYPYALTVTAIGHAALVTGTPPRLSGIAGNHWFDREKERWVDVTEDARYPVTGAPVPKDDGASPQALVADAVSDTPGKNVVSVSYKERAAIMMGGHKAKLAVWYEPKRQAFVTSAYYTKEEPAWLAKLAADHPIAPRLQGYVWTPLAETPSRALTGDDSPGETDGQGLKVKFPHELKNASRPELAVGLTPLAVDFQVEAALAALDAERPDFLAFSISTHDYAAHNWGQESWEATDVLFRMDASLGQFLDGLDARYGKDGWSLVFSSDHGGPPMPERVGGKRVDLDAIEKAAEAAAVKAVGKRADGKPHILAIDDHSIYLRPSPSATASADPLKDAVAAAVGKIAGVEFSLRADRCGTPMVCDSIHPDRSGDIYFSPKENHLIQKKPFGGDNHGTHYDYDRQVPVIVREPGRPARVLADQHPSILSVAPTLARLLGVPAPKSAKEPAL